MNEQPNSAIEPIETDEQAVLCLLRFFRPGQLVTFANLLQRVCTETRFGDVNVIIAEGKAQHIKVTQSY